MEMSYLWAWIYPWIWVLSVNISRLPIDISMNTSMDIDRIWYMTQNMYGYINGYIKAPISIDTSMEIPECMYLLIYRWAYPLMCLWICPWMYSWYAHECPPPCLWHAWRAVSTARLLCWNSYRNPFTAVPEFLLDIHPPAGNPSRVAAESVRDSDRFRKELTKGQCF